MTIKRRDVEAALERKGFRRRDADHAFFHYYTQDGKKTIVRTKTSQGTKYKDIGTALIQRMAKQCRISIQDFTDLVNCSLSQDEYERKLFERDEI